VFFAVIGGCALVAATALEIAVGHPADIAWGLLSAPFYVAGLAGVLVYVRAVLAMRVPEAHQVSRLIRTSYGPFELGDLPPGSAKEVAPQLLKKAVAGYFTVS